MNSEAGSDNGYVAAVIKVDGGYRVRLFYTDGCSQDHVWPPLPTALDAVRAMLKIAKSLD